MGQLKSFDEDFWTVSMINRRNIEATDLRGLHIFTLSDFKNSSWKLHLEDFDGIEVHVNLMGK